MTRSPVRSSRVRTLRAVGNIGSSSARGRAGEVPRIVRLLERPELRPAPLTALPPLADHIERLDATMVVADYGARSRAEGCASAD